MRVESLRSLTFCIILMSASFLFTTLMVTEMVIPGIVCSSRQTKQCTEFSESFLGQTWRSHLSRWGVNSPSEASRTPRRR